MAKNKVGKLPTISDILISIPSPITVDNHNKEINKGIKRLPSAKDKGEPWESIDNYAKFLIKYHNNPDEFKTTIKPKPDIKCPLCKSNNISDNSTYSNNGICGPSYHSYKTSDSRCCNECGIIFKPVKGNGLDE